jgi:hypothetical protein
MIGRRNKRNAQRVCTLYHAPASARITPPPVSFWRRRTAVRLVVVNTHEAEDVRGERALVMVRPEPHLTSARTSEFDLPETCSGSAAICCNVYCKRELAFQDGYDSGERSRSSRH